MCHLFIPLCFRSFIYSSMIHPPVHLFMYLLIQTNIVISPHISQLVYSRTSREQSLTCNESGDYYTDSWPVQSLVIVSPGNGRLCQSWSGTQHRCIQLQQPADTASSGCGHRQTVQSAGKISAQLSTLRASLSGAVLQTLPKSVTQLKGHPLSKL